MLCGTRLPVTTVCAPSSSERAMLQAGPGSDQAQRRCPETVARRPSRAGESACGKNLLPAPWCPQCPPWSAFVCLPPLLLFCTLQLLARPHYLLVTLLLCNAAAMEALPIFLASRGAREWGEAKWGAASLPSLSKATRC